MKKQTSIFTIIFIAALSVLAACRPAVPQAGYAEMVTPADDKGYDRQGTVGIPAKKTKSFSPYHNI